MKPKLLITLGCSFTEGMGCYDYSKIPPSKSDSQLPKEQLEYQSNRFHELGWPNRLGKKLNYDKVINLGLSGSSTSGQSKQFYEKYLDKDFSNYDVLVIWLLSDPSRISFYSDSMIKNTMPASPGGSLLENGYIEFIFDIKKDTLLEQLYYIKTIQQVCENKGYSLLLAHSNVDMEIELKNIYKSNFYFSNEIEDFFGKGMSDSKYLSKICSHPNEDGYELLSQRMFNQIEKNHPYFINHSKVNKFEWDWDGNPKDWNNEW
jgi:hypothetical protein